MHMPSAAEALAEAALLEECAAKFCIPDRRSCYSYWPTQENSASGYFEPYLVGLKERQRAVARAIAEYAGDPAVRYVDIKAFYPSIRIEIARQSWTEYCQECSISDETLKLGLSILDRHRVAGDGTFILTGPMFSHFLGNLLLKDIDSSFSRDFKTEVFRYVDDFIFVGAAEEVLHDVELLSSRLKELGLEIHPPESEKSITLTGETWLRSEKDFESGEISVSWMNLIGDIKKLLIFNLARGDELITDLQNYGFRLPIRAYEAAVKEASEFEKIRELGLWVWLSSKLRGVSSSAVRGRALDLRRIIERQLDQLFELKVPDDPFERKRLATKLRYRMGRALYVCEDEFLQSLQRHAPQWPELEVHFAISQAIVSKECDRVAAMGVNVAQAAAQLFAAADETAIFIEDVGDDVSAMGLAVFIVNGVPVQAPTVVDRPILQLATGPISLQTMESSTGFMQELACLHGAGDVRHGDIMSKAFDVGEDVHFDAIALDYGYSF